MFWIHAVWVYFFQRLSAKWSDVEYFIFSDSEQEKLYKEEEINLPDANLATYDDGHIEYRMDVMWHLIQQLNSPAGSCYNTIQYFIDISPKGFSVTIINKY